MALGLRPPRQPARLIDLASAHPASIGPANVILWGSAQTPLKNALFISNRIAEIRSILESLPLGTIHYLTLYGHGPDVPGKDTSYIVSGKIRFKRAGLVADLSADATDFNSVLTGVRRNAASRSLLIQVGHSGPTGSPLWGSGLTMVPSDLALIEEESHANLIMISGACNSGMFAKSVQCGFFAAHPDVIASGCQLSPKVLEKNSDDYLKFFFRAVSGADSSTTAGDTPHGTTTLSAAHWYATTHLEEHQISYTTTDALIDEYFNAHSDRLPPAVTVRDMMRYVGILTDDESRALAALTTGLPQELSISLTGYIELNHEAETKLIALMLPILLAGCGRSVDPDSQSPRHRKGCASFLPGVADLWRRWLYLSISD